MPTRRASGWLRPHAEDLPADPDAPGAGLVIGVLALQGAFAEHSSALQRLGAFAVEVRRPEHLEGLDALVMPGGESTTMSKLAASCGLDIALRKRLDDGFPAFGTCAGMILLATGVLDGRPDQVQLDALDIDVRRNGYGRQVDSFEVDLAIDGLTEPFRAVFIRAPRIERVGDGVEVLASHVDVPVLVRHGNVMAASFHPEITPDLRVHKLFIESVVRAQNT